MWKILFTVLFSGVFVIINAQSPSEGLSFANSLYNKNQYSEALKLYKRVLFLNDGLLNKYCYRKIAECNSSVQNYEESVKYYDLAYYVEENDSIKNEITFQKIHDLLSINKIVDVKSELFTVDTPLNTLQINIIFIQVLPNLNLVITWRQKTNFYYL